MVRLVPCKLPLCCIADELPLLATAAVRAPELLVARCRGAVLHRLPDDLPDDREACTWNLTPRSPRRRIGHRDRRLVRLFDCAHVDEPPTAFFSPLTRAWELALGGLIAVAGQPLRRIPQFWAALISWLGLVAIVVVSVTYTATTVYPGASVALPVVGAGFVIAGGAAQPVWGVERLLRQRPFQLLGLISYSLYLWHWPILIIATQSRGTTTLPVWDNVLWLLVATVAAAVTYWFLENPVCHSRFLIGRRWASIIVGLCLIGATVGVTTNERHRVTLDLGPLASALPGSVCYSPSSSDVSKARSTYLSGHPERGDGAVRQSLGSYLLEIRRHAPCSPGLKQSGRHMECNSRTAP